MQTMDPSKPIAKGRGALILKALQKAQETRPGDQTLGAGEPPKPRGRAALLNRLKEMQIGAAGKGDEDRRPEAKDEEVPGAIKRCVSSAKPPPPETSSISPEAPARDAKAAAASTYRGTSGHGIHLTANYVRFAIRKDKGVFEHDVQFQPPVDAKHARVRLVHANLAALGGVMMFDGGSYLYLPAPLPKPRTVFRTPHPIDPDTLITVTVTYIKTKRFGECIQLFNILFKRVMAALQLSRIGRNYYDAAHSKLIPQHKLEILPGYAVAVDECEGGLMVCLDSEHRVLRTVSVLDHMKELRSVCPERFNRAVVDSLIGTIVITKYNNKTYVIDDILWDFTPKDTFETSRGEKISFQEYYQRQHGITIHDLNQPLLLNLVKKKIPGSAKEEDMNLCLVPELCYLTGLSDAMRSDFKVMKDVAAFTRISPHQRMHALKTYLENVRNSPKAQQILSDWGVKMEDASIDLNARILSPELIMFGGGASHQNDMRADWSNPLSKNRLVGPVDIRCWVMIYPQRDQKIAQEFAASVPRLGNTMGCKITAPEMFPIQNDRTTTYTQACEAAIHDNIQCVVFICPTVREDLYRAIKKFCCIQRPVASQVIIARSLQNPKKVRTITLKIVLQINCKLGGALWALKIPVKTWMVCGIDTFHSPRNKMSVGSLVCTTNENMTGYYTNVVMQEKELSDALKMPFLMSLMKWREVNGDFPRQIVIYRDGVGDGQFDHVRQYELQQFLDAIKQLNITNIDVAMIVVQKRINTRLVSNDSSGNPPPGTILDNTITRRHLYDFYLIPQCVSQGTVSPSRYIVLHDSAGLRPDHVQKLTYKLCHLYYNWSGTIRVPAPCKYADKSAYLVGQTLGKLPSEILNDRLYFL